jgi:hypothetical protein
MKVVNVCGITYGFTHKGRTIIIPYDERVYTLDDDVDMSQFGNSIRVIEPPKPKFVSVPAPETSIVKVDLTIIEPAKEPEPTPEITVPDEPKIEDKVVDVVVKKPAQKRTTKKSVKKPADTSKQSF